MTTRRDIPGRGEGPEIGRWAAVDLRTGQVMWLSTEDATLDHLIVLTMVPHGGEPPKRREDLEGAPAMADVIEFARRKELDAAYPASPEVAAALARAREARDPLPASKSPLERNVDDIVEAALDGEWQRVESIRARLRTAGLTMDHTSLWLALAHAVRTGRAEKRRRGLLDGIDEWRLAPTKEQ